MCCKFLALRLVPNVLQVDIPIHVLEGDSMFVTFEGHGFDERHSEPIQVKDGCITVPSTQKIPTPGQVRKYMRLSLHTCVLTVMPISDIVI